MVEGAALLLSDLGVTRAVLSAAWFPGDRRARKAEKRDGEVLFPARPFLPELEVALPSLHFRSVVCSCEIPRSERGISRLLLLHRHDHTPHYDSAIRQPDLLLPQVAGAAQEPRRALIEVSTIFLSVVFSWRSRNAPPAE